MTQTLNDTPRTISAFLRSIGFRATYIGFQYLVCAISLVMSNESYLHSLTTRLYPCVADIYGISAVSVERAMRFMINVFWDHGNVALLEDRLGYPMHDRPSIGEFIDVIAFYISCKN